MYCTREYIVAWHQTTTAEGKTTSKLKSKMRLNNEFRCLRAMEPTNRMLVRVVPYIHGLSMHRNLAAAVVLFYCRCCFFFASST